MATWTKINISDTGPALELATFLVGRKNTGESVVFYQGTGVSHSAPNTTSTAVIDTLNDQNFPVREGDIHLEIPNCICLKRQIVAGPAHGWCIVAVTYGPPPYLHLRGGPRLFGRPESILVPMEQPNWIQVTNGTISRYQWAPRTIYRTKIIRRRPVLVTGSADLVAAQIEPNIGKAYTFNYPGFPAPPSIPVVLGGYGFAETENQGEMIVTYEFYTYAPVGAVPANAQQGVGVMIPALGYFEDYAYEVASPVPSIAVRPHMVLVAGGTLP